jgi:hypothetical protein
VEGRREERREGCESDGDGGGKKRGGTREGGREERSALTQ